MSKNVNATALSVPQTNLQPQMPAQMPVQLPGQSGQSASGGAAASAAVLAQQQSIPLNTAALAAAPPPQGAQQGGSLHKTRLLTGIASNVLQHVILARDCSSSMARGKIRELNIASGAFVTAIKAPDNKGAFRLTVIDFNNGSNRRLFGEKAEGLALPEAVASGGTNFDSALLETIQAVKDFEGQPNPDGFAFMRPHVLFLSDGFSPVTDRNIHDLHEIADVTTIAYGRDANSDMLERISSTGRVEVVGTDGGVLRDFLAQMGHSISQQLQMAT